MSEKNDDGLPATREFTPTTDAVKAAALYWAVGRGRGSGTLEDRRAAGAEFDRWLNSVSAAAWEAGFDACANWWEIHHHGTVRDELNPYAPAVGGHSPVSLEGDK